MRVVMVTPHLPPEQAANALLPMMLARELGRTGVEVAMLGHPPAGARGRAPGGAAGPRTIGASTARGRASVGFQAEGGSSYVPRRGRGWFQRTPVGAVVAALRMAAGLHRVIRRADLVHLHSNGLIIEVAGWLARRLGLPYLITLYGTDVWHHDPKRHGRFARVVRDASHRVFYSRGLLEFARERGLGTEPASVIYAPVAPHFRPLVDEERRRLRAASGVGEEPLLVTVKRLHPVAGHEDLVRALPAVVQRFPDARLWLVGDGPLRSDLAALVAALGLGRHVHFLGVVPNEELPRYLGAADLFVLPSRLESWGTVMLEALACGTPVVATATAGAQEVRALFPDDVRTCAVGDPTALAAAIVDALGTMGPTSAATRARLSEQFGPAACATAYRTVYEAALAGR